jgi:DNA-binding SARP family transcriptional activator
MPSKQTDSIAKITCPTLKSVVHRKGLYARLDDCTDKPIIWISGPGGSGKTTLIASYLASRKVRRVWYQMDSGDADMATFIYHLNIAAKNATPKARGPLPFLTPEYLLGITAFARRYFAVLYERLKTPAVLVFDNYQDVPPDAGLHEIILAGLSMVPPGMQIILISRNEPPPTLIRLQANGIMTSFGWNDLRLNLQEIEELVHLRQGKKPGIDLLQRLHKATDGWAAGLVLMMDETYKGKEMSSEETALPQERIFQYFVAEVFNHLEKQTRDFLLKTAYLPILSASIARKVTGLNNAEQILADLNHHNFFTTKHAQQEALYQYHQLFREFLLARGNRIFSADQITSLKLTAADALEATGQGEAALALFLQTCDWNNAVRLLCNLAPRMISQGRSRVVSAWLSELPNTIAEQTPWVLYWRGVCMMPFDPFESKKEFDRAYHVFLAQDDRAGVFLSWAGAVDCAFFGADYFPLDVLIPRLENILRENPLFPSSEIGVVVTVGMFSALSFRRPQHPDIRFWEKKTLDFFRTNPPSELRTKAGVYLAVYYLWMGEIANATIVLDKLRKSLISSASDLMRLTVMTTEALYDYFQSDCEACIKKTFETIRLGEESRVRVWENHVVGHGLVAALSNGDLKTAEIMLEKMKPDKSTGRADSHYYHGAQICKALIEGNRHAALGHYKEYISIMRDVGDIQGIVVNHIINYEMLYILGKYREADNHLAEAHKLAHSMGSTMIEYMCLIMETHIAFQLKDDQRGFRLLRKAMTLGREKGFMNMYWWRPTVMSVLCRKALEAEIEINYVQDIIRKRGLLPEQNAPVPANWPYPLQIFTLGRFEIAIDGKPLLFSGKAQHKPLAFLKTLISLGGSAVPSTKINDLLWPEADGYSAHRSGELALYRLRKMLGTDKVLQVHDEKLTLDARYCFVDVFNVALAFEKSENAWKGLRDKKKSVTVKKKSNEPESAISLSEMAINMYQGHFLPADIQLSWTSSLRNRMRSKFIQTTSNLGRYWAETKQYDKAIECFQKGLEIDDLCEEFYQQLMICYHKLGRKAEAVTTYRRCHTRIAAVLNITPSSKTEEIYNSVSRLN